MPSPLGWAVGWGAGGVLKLRKLWTRKEGYGERALRLQGRQSRPVHTPSSTSPPSTVNWGQLPPRTWRRDFCRGLSVRLGGG